MATTYLCDTTRADYEQYLKQAVLFREGLNVVYPHIEYTRALDVKKSEQLYASIDRYRGFEGINIVPVIGKYNRVFDESINPVLFNTICEELCLDDYSKRCFRAYAQQQFDYEVFMDSPPWRNSCVYMHEIYNIVLQYLDELGLFYSTYEKNGGNIITNSSLLHRILSIDLSNGVDGAKLPAFDLRAEYGDFRAYTQRHCTECKEHISAIKSPASPVNVKTKAIEFLLPDYSFLQPDDLFELRTKAADEIQALSDYVDQLSFVIQDEVEAENQIRQKINPAVKALEAKVKGLTLTAIQSALSVKDIATVPILTALLPKIPAYIPIIGSAAFMGAKTGIEITKEKVKLKADPLYFKIVLDKKMKRIIRKKKRKKNNA